MTVNTIVYDRNQLPRIQNKINHSTIYREEGFCGYKYKYCLL